MSVVYDELHHATVFNAHLHCQFVICHCVVVVVMVLVLVVVVVVVVLVVVECSMPIYTVSLSFVTV